MGHVSKPMRNLMLSAKLFLKPDGSGNQQHLIDGGTHNLGGKLAPLLILLCAICLAGCGSYTPEFSQYIGPNIRTGNGGTCLRIDGMDVWNSGTPPRKFQILGTMESEGGRHSDVEFETGLIAKAARSKGADAIILVSTDSRMEGVNLYSGRFEQSPDVVAMLIKYL